MSRMSVTHTRFPAVQFDFIKNYQFSSFFIKIIF